jgi:hypothetical protein
MLSLCNTGKNRILRHVSLVLEGPNSQVLTFDPEGVKPYVLHKTCQKTHYLSENA